MTPEEMRNIAAKSGKKYYAIAGEVGISPSSLSKHLREKQMLPSEKAKRLEDYFIKLSNISISII